MIASSSSLNSYFSNIAHCYIIINCGPQWAVATMALAQPRRTPNLEILSLNHHDCIFEAWTTNFVLSMMCLKLRCKNEYLAIDIGQNI